MGATRGQILWLKCTKIDFGWGSSPDSAGGLYRTHPHPLSGFKGPTSKGGEGRREGREGKIGRRGGRTGTGRKRRRERREGKGKDGEERGGGKNPTPFKMSVYGLD